MNWAFRLREPRAPLPNVWVPRARATEEKGADLAIVGRLTTPRPVVFRIP